MFSEVGDLLEPKRRKIGPQLLTAIHCVRAWHRAGFRAKGFNEDDKDDEELAHDSYNTTGWDSEQIVNRNTNYPVL